MQRANIFFALAFTTFACALHAQGIQFEKTNWQSVLQKAKSENKLIFVDFYTSWCYPCKMMAKEVYPQKEVGDLYNAQFVNVMIDAEKGEGIALAKKFSVDHYPTLLFMDANEKIAYRSVGRRGKNDFLNDATIAKEEFTYSTSLSVMDSLYATGKKDSSFLLIYARKKLRQNVDNAIVLDKYLQALPTKRRLTKENMDLIIRSKRMLANGVAFNLLIDNSDSARVLLNMQKRKRGWRNYLQQSIYENLKLAAETKDENLLSEVIKANQKIPFAVYEGFPQNEDELLQKYFYLSNQSEKYIAQTLDYFENRLLKKTANEISIKDSLAHNEWMDIFKENPKVAAMDSISFKKRYDIPRWQNAYTRRIAWQLQLAADEFEKKVTDSIHLRKALSWVKWAYEKNDFSYECGDVYARLLFKNGFYEEAIKIETKAIKETIKEDKELRILLPKTLAKMKSDYAKIKKQNAQLPKVKLTDTQPLN